MPSITYCAKCIQDFPGIFNHHDWAILLPAHSIFAALKVLVTLALDLVRPTRSTAAGGNCDELRSKHKEVKAQLVAQLTSSTSKSFTLFTPERQMLLRAKYAAPAEDFIAAVNKFSFSLSPTGSLLALNVETGLLKPVLDCVHSAARGGDVSLSNSQLLQEQEHSFKGCEHPEVTDLNMLRSTGFQISVDQLALALWRHTPPFLLAPCLVTSVHQ